MTMPTKPNTPANSTLNSKKSKSSIDPKSYEYSRIDYILAKAALLRETKDKCKDINNDTKHKWTLTGISKADMKEVCDICGHFKLT